MPHRNHGFLFFSKSFSPCTVHGTQTCIFSCSFIPKKLILVTIAIQNFVLKKFETHLPTREELTSFPPKYLGCAETMYDSQNTRVVFNKSRELGVSEVPIVEAIYAIVMLRAVWRGVVYPSLGTRVIRPRTVLFHSSFLKVQFRLC